MYFQHCEESTCVLSFVDTGSSLCAAVLPIHAVVLHHRAAVIPLRAAALPLCAGNDLFVETTLWCIQLNTTVSARDTSYCSRFKWPTTFMLSLQ